MEQHEQVDRQPRRITFDDVREAVDQLGGNPNRTNAMAVRKVLGSGGFNTIQKHLETLRGNSPTSKVNKRQETGLETPSALFNEIWTQALTEARSEQEKTLGAALKRIDELEGILHKLQEERNEAVKRAESAEITLETERRVMTGERVLLDYLTQKLKIMIHHSE